MKYLIGVAVLLITSCGQRSWTKRGENHGWITSETIIDTIVTDSSRVDTLFKNHIVRDTVILKDNKLTVKYFYNIKDSTVYLSGKCDPDTIRVEKVINNIHAKYFSETEIYIMFILLILLILGIIWKGRK